MTIYTFWNMWDCDLSYHTTKEGALKEANEWLETCGHYNNSEIKKFKEQLIKHDCAFTPEICCGCICEVTEIEVKED